ncbi:MAG: hypothetical protein N2381_04225 [Armatimonadetes bacterium]|nr:hypothetical protein [Armatimonadota bacterium]
MAAIDNQLAQLKEAKLFLAIGVPSFTYHCRLTALVSPLIGVEETPVETEIPAIEAAQHLLCETPQISLKRGERASLSIFSYILVYSRIFSYILVYSRKRFHAVKCLNGQP